MKNTVCVLANNPAILKVMMDNLGDKDNCRFIVVNEIRYNACMEQLEEILEKSGVAYQLLSSLDVCKACLKYLELSKDGMAFFKSYRMGMNVLLPLYMGLMNYKKVLFTDDDVLLLKGFQQIFDLPASSFQKSTFVNNYRPEEDYTKFFLDLANCDGEHWCKNYVANGHFLIDYSDFSLSLYADMLDVFFNSETVHTAWHNFLSGKRKGRGWFLDMTFITAIAIRMYKTVNFDLSKLCVIAQWKDKKTNVPKPSKLLFHYCVRDKEKYISMLKKNGYIR